jgi:cobalt-precorrin 5A hydrolase
MTARRSLALYAITRHGVAIASTLRDALPGADLFVSEKLASLAPEGSLPLPLPMGPTLARTFEAYDGHIFVISVGAVVRMIAPLLKNKKVDPAVVCVDDTARFAICVLSGHVGRGNAFTERVAERLGAQAVITTASDALGTLTVDILGRELGWTLDDPDRNVTRGCAAVVNAAPVLFVQETGEPSFWPLTRPLPEGVAYATSLSGVDPSRFEIVLLSTDRDLASVDPSVVANAVVYRPKSLVLGLGCDRGAPAGMVARGVDALLREHGLSSKSVKAIATIDKKGDEEAFLALSQARGWPLVTYAAEELDRTPGIVTPSETVKAFVGTRGVCEPAALLASGAQSLLVAKRAYTEEGAGRSMTFAAARIPFAHRTEQAGDGASAANAGSAARSTPEEVKNV